MAYTFAQLKQLLINNGGGVLGDAVLNTLAAIGLAESAGDATVRRYCAGNGTCQITRNGRTTTVAEVAGQLPEDSVGLWQINRRAWGGTPQSLGEANRNAQIAIEAYKKQGYNAWRTTYTRGTYKKYLGGANSPSGNSQGWNGANATGSGVSAPNPFVFDTSVEVFGAKNRYLIAFAILVIIFIFAFN